MKFWFGKDKGEEVGRNPGGAPSAPADGAGTVVPPPPAPAPAIEAEPKPSLPVPEVRVPAATDAQPMSNPKVNQRDLYCRLMNGLYDAILVLDAKGHVVDSNERVNAIFGYTCDDMWDKPASEIIRGFGPRLLAQIAEPLDAHRPVIVDGHCVRSDGTVFAAEIAIGRVSLGHNENLVLSIRDVEKRICALKERLRAEMAGNRSKGLVRLVLKTGTGDGAADAKM